MSTKLAVVGVVSLMVAACGPARTCRNKDAPPTYNADVKAIVATKCENCHSVQVKGADRHGADPSLNYETYSKLKLVADTAAQRLEKGDMPPKNMGVEDLTAAERDTILQWIYCDSPE